MLSRYNKVVGGTIGAGVAALVFVVFGVDVSDTVEKVVEVATILVGVFAAPANSPE